MMRLLACLLLVIAVWEEARATAAPDSLVQADTAVADTLRDRDYWRRALRRGKLDLKDTTVVYPAFLDFCVDAYRWYDSKFNTFDSTYVVPAGKKWKFQIKYNGLVGAYHGRNPELGKSLFLNSDLSSSVGLRVQFLAFGFEYAPDIDNLLSGRILDHRKTRFTFTNSRLSVDMYYIKSEGMTHIHRFADYNDGHYFSLDYNGMSRRVLGIDAYYFFNFNRYAHTAGYTFSKIQRRSAGSFLLGMQWSKQEAHFDISRLPEPLLEALPEGVPGDVDYRMRDYAVNVGYGYNWVFHRHWLFNVMAAPSVGFKHVESSDLGRSRYHVATNFRGRLALAHQQGKLYYGLNASINCYLFNTRRYNINAIIADFNIVTGFQF